MSRKIRSATANGNIADGVSAPAALVSIAVHVASTLRLRLKRGTGSATLLDREGGEYHIAITDDGEVRVVCGWLGAPHVAQSIRRGMVAMLLDLGAADEVRS